MYYLCTGFEKGPALAANPASPKPLMNKYPNIQLLTAAVLAIGGMILLFCGLYIEPQGEIEESVLVAFGEVMTFSGSLMGIDYHYKTKYHYKPKNPDNNAQDNTRT